MAGLNPKIGLESKWETTWWPIQVFAFFIACTEVNVYLAMKYFLKTYDKFMDFGERMDQALINNSYTNDKTCGSPANFRKRQLSHILETAPTHATENNEKNEFAQQNINTNNTSDVGQIVKNTYEHVARVAWEPECEKSITLCMFWRNL